ncbi:hypothetical protein JVT61DRAFT_12542 [Boletus reticuloceps]|uniref:Uncharacterized protein n=1 Tax=Boletus reticuloceps TaxID=495285 RepID=A0A8I3A431_9AGAM|nr:hypothetical protein JVT61DRAFT_12542 [Boletus reticuloceps]
MLHITPHCPRCVEGKAHCKETIDAGEFLTTGCHASTYYWQAMFPFLPLPSTFKATDTYQWQQLTKQIEYCLVADPLLDSKHPECYCLMRELFWMAFVAANPDFPRGKWARWDAAIPMEGDFISRWMSEDPQRPDVPLHVIIWEQFRNIISDELLIPCVQ